VQALEKHSPEDFHDGGGIGVGKLALNSLERLNLCYYENTLIKGS
jgi:hypothetical protein